jgi:hypothetical protein
MPEDSNPASFIFNRHPSGMQSWVWTSGSGRLAVTAAITDNLDDILFWLEKLGYAKSLAEP